MRFISFRMLDAQVARTTHRLAGERLDATTLRGAAEPFRQILAVRVLDLAALMLRAMAILLLLSPILVGTLLVFG
jgi:hypothetical protein